MYMNHSRTQGEGCARVKPETGLSPPPSNLLLTVPRRCFCRGLIYLSMFVRFLLVFDLLFILFRIALWPSAGKELSLLLFTCVVFIFSAVLVVRVPFIFGVWDRVWNSIVSVPDHCLFIYFAVNCLPFCRYGASPVK